MDSRFLNARSPLRMLEKGLHGGLGRGNLGVVIAGHGVGKSSFLVGVALDELLRGGCVLHVAVGESVSHVRAHYDTVFDELAAKADLADLARVRAGIDRNRRIRAYAAFDAGKLREAARLESELGARPALVVIEGFDPAAAPRPVLADLKTLAGELDAEVWLSAASEEGADPAASLRRADDYVSVILALEPHAGHVRLRALKDHANPDVADLHVALDPKTLLLVRS